VENVGGETDCCVYRVFEQDVFVVRGFHRQQACKSGSRSDSLATE
jgi:hypothetical protein